MSDEPRSLAPVEAHEMSDPMSAGSLSIKAVKAQVSMIGQLMREVLVEGEDYGNIPGCQKPSLFKPGAEKIALMFRLDAQVEHEKEWDGQHLTVNSRCTLYHIPTGQRIGSGEGLCTTKETKYAFRNAAKKCPKCGKEAIIKGKAEYGGGWLCWTKRDGCGEKWPDGAPDIENQADGKTANENLADQYNTIVQMANKRAVVSAVRMATAAGSIFRQDVEDMDLEPDAPPAKAPLAAPQAKSAAKAPNGNGGLSMPQIKRMFAMLHENGKTEEQLKDYLKHVHGIESTKDLTAESYQATCDWIEGK